MVLTDKEIRKYSIDYKKMKLDKPIIEDFQENNLQSESYDVTIGSKIATFKKEVRCLELSEQESIDTIYESVDMVSNDGYVISPQEYILVTLKERINMPDFLTAHIRPRTKFTRLGLIVSDQHCNSTYSGKLQIGLHNCTNYAIKIRPGIKIAQIVFEELKSKPSDEKLYKNKANASYQNESSFIGAKFNGEFAEKLDSYIDKMFE